MMTVVHAEPQRTSDSAKALPMRVVEPVDEGASTPAV